MPTILPADTVWSLYNTPGSPGSGVKRPDKDEILPWARPIEGLSVTDANYTIQNSVDKGRQIRCFGNTYKTVTLGAASGYDSDFWCEVVNMPNTRAKQVVVTGVLTENIYPTQSVLIFKKSGAWQSYRMGAWRPRSMVTFNADYTNGDDANDGLATGSGNAFKLASTALGTGLQNIEFTNAVTTNLTIQLADGTMSDALHFAGIAARSEGTAEIIIQGNASNASAAILSSSGISCVSSQLRAVILVRNLKLTCTGAGQNCLEAIRGGHIYHSNVVFGSSDGAHILAGRGGSLVELHNSVSFAYHIAGNAAIHAQALNGGSIVNASGTITFDGNAAFSTCFAYVQGMAQQNWAGSTISLGGHTVTGQKHQVGPLSFLETDTGNTAFFPGDVAGTVDALGKFT